MMSSDDAPLPKFTIEELLRQAVEAVPSDKRCVFTMRELAALWGYRSLNSARRQLYYLEQEGWKFAPTQTEFINRAGALTTKSAYIVTPPSMTPMGDTITEEEQP